MNETYNTIVKHEQEIHEFHPGDRVYVLVPHGKVNEEAKKYVGKEWTVVGKSAINPDWYKLDNGPMMFHYSILRPVEYKEYNLDENETIGLFQE